MSKKHTSAESVIPKDSIVYNKDVQAFEAKKQADASRIAGNQESGLRDASIGLKYEASEYGRLLQAGDYGGGAEDIEGRLGDRQTAWGQWANGVARFIPIVGTKIASSLLGARNVIKEIGTGFDGSSYVDDELSDGVAKWEENVKEYFPIYSKTGYDKGGLATQLMSAKFWADEALDGVAFMAAQAAITYATAGAASGIGVAGRAAGIAGQVANASKIAKLAASGAKTIGLGAMSAMQEAAIEAHGSATTVKQQLEGKANPLTGQLYTKEEIHQKAAQAAASTFSANSAALMLPAMWETRILMGMGKKAVAKGLASAAKNAVKKGTVTAGELIGGMGSEALHKSGTRAFLKGTAQGFAIEGLWEENVQNAIQNYDVDNAVAGKTPGLTTRTLEYAEGMLDNLTTTEGQKAIILGGVIGGPMGGFGAKSSVKNFNESADKFVTSLAAANRTLLGNTKSYLKTGEDGSIVLDEQGNPVVDEKAAMQLTQQVMTTKRLADKHAMAALQGNEQLMKLNADISVGSAVWNAVTNPAFDSAEESVTFLKWHHEQILREQGEEQQEGIDEAVAEEGSKEQTEAKTATKKSTASDQAYVSGVINKHLQNVDNMVKAYKEVENKAVELNEVNQDEERTAFNEVLKKGMFYERIKQQSIQGMIQDKQTELMEARKDRVDDATPTLTEQKIEKEINGLQEAHKDSLTKYNQYHEQPEEAYKAWNAPHARYKELTKELNATQASLAKAKEGDDVSSLQAREKELTYMQGELLEKEGPAFQDSTDGKAKFIARESVIATEQQTRVQQKTGRRYAYYEKAATGVRALAKIQNKIDKVKADTMRILGRVDELLATDVDLLTEDSIPGLTISPEVRDLVDMVTANIPILDQETIDEVQQVIDERRQIVEGLQGVVDVIEQEPMPAFEADTVRIEAEQAIVQVNKDVDAAQADLQKAIDTSEKKQDLFSPEKIEDHLTEEIAREYNAKGEHILSIALDPSGEIKEDFFDIRSTEAAIQQANVMRDVIQSRTDGGDLQGKQVFKSLVTETNQMIDKLNTILAVAKANKNNRDAKQADLNLKEGQKMVDLLSIPDSPVAKLINNTVGGKLEKLIEQARQVPGAFHEAMTAIVDHALETLGEEGRMDLRVLIEQQRKQIGEELLPLVETTSFSFREYLANPELVATNNEYETAVRNRFGTITQRKDSKSGLRARFARENDIYDIKARIAKVTDPSELMSGDIETELKLYDIYQKLVSLAKLEEQSRTNTSAAVAVMSKDEALKEDGKFSPTTQQDVAIRELTNWWNKPSANTNNWAYLRGVAGTGKTNVVFRWMLSLLPGLKADQIVTASNLRTAAGVVANVAGTDALTYQELMNTDLEGKKLVVIDEYGTLTSQELKAFKEKVNTFNKGKAEKVKVMILGDPTQISPRISDDVDFTVMRTNTDAHRMTVISPLTVVYRSDVSAINELSDIFQAETAPVASISGRSNKEVGEAGAIGVQVVGNSDSILQTIAANLANPASKDRNRAILVEDQTAVDKYNEQLAQQRLEGVNVLSVYDAQSMTFEEVYVDLPIDTLLGNGSNSELSKAVRKSNTKMYTAVSRAKEFAMVIYPDSKNVKDESLQEEKDTNIDRIKDARNAYHDRKSKEVKMYENLQAGKPLSDDLEAATVAQSPETTTAENESPEAETELEEDQEWETEEDEDTVRDEDEDKSTDDNGDPYQGGVVDPTGLVSPSLQDNIPNIDKQASAALKAGELNVGDEVYYVHAETPSSNSNKTAQRSIQILAKTQNGNLIRIGQVFQTEMSEMPTQPILTRAEVDSAMKSGDTSLLQDSLIKTARISEAQYLHIAYKTGNRQDAGIVSKIRDAFRNVFPGKEPKVTYHIFSYKKQGEWGKLGIPKELVGKPVAIIRPDNAKEDDFTNAKYVELKTKALREDDGNVAVLKEFHDAARAITESLDKSKGQKSAVRMGQPEFEQVIRAMKGALEVKTVEADLARGDKKEVQVRTAPFTYEEFVNAFNTNAEKSGSKLNIKSLITSGEYQTIKDSLLTVAKNYYGTGVVTEDQTDEDGKATKVKVTGLVGGKGHAQVAFNRIAKANEYVGNTRIRQATPVEKGKLRNSGKSLLSSRNADDSAIYPLLRAMAVMKGARNGKEINDEVSLLRKDLRKKEKGASPIEHIIKMIEEMGGDVDANLKTALNVVNAKQTKPVTLDTLAAIVSPEAYTNGEHSTTYTDKEGTEKPAFLRKPLSMNSFNKLGKDPEANDAFFQEAVYTNFEGVAPTRIRVSMETLGDTSTTVTETARGVEEDVEAKTTRLKQEIKERKANGEDTSGLMEELRNLRQAFDAAVRTLIPSASLTIEQAKAELKKLIPNISEQEMEFVDKAMLNKMALPGEDLLGLFNKGKIYLALDKGGTVPRSILRHEAFHKIFNEYLTSGERATLKAELDPNNQLSLSEFDEQLADKFMDWKSQPESFGDKVRRIFQKILNWIGFAKENQITLASLFEGIEKGRYTTQVSGTSTARRAFNNIAKAFGNSMTYIAAMNMVESRIKHYRTADLTRVSVFTKQELKARVLKDLRNYLGDIEFAIEMEEAIESELNDKPILERLLAEDHFDRVWKTIYQGYTEGKTVAEMTEDEFAELTSGEENWLTDLVAESDSFNEEGSATDRVKDAIAFIEYKGKPVNPRMGYAVALKALQGLRASSSVDLANQIGKRAKALKIKEGTKAGAVIHYLLNLFSNANANREVIRMDINGKNTRIEIPLPDSMKFANNSSFVMARNGEDISGKVASEITSRDYNLELRNGLHTVDFIKRIALKVTDPAMVAKYGEETALQIAEIQVKALFRKYQAQQEAAAVYSHFASHREAEYYKGQFLYDGGLQVRYVKAHLTGKEVAMREKLKHAIGTNWAPNQTALSAIFEKTEGQKRPKYKNVNDEILALLGLKDKKVEGNNVRHTDAEVYEALYGFQRQIEENSRDRVNQSNQEDTAEEEVTQKTIADEAEESNNYMNILMDYLIGDEHLQAKKMKGADGKNKFPFHLGSQALENVQRLMEHFQNGTEHPAHVRPTNTFSSGISKIFKIVDHDGFGWKDRDFSTTYSNENAANWMTRTFGLGFLGFATVYTTSNSYIQYFYTNSNKPTQKGAEVSLLSYAKQREGIGAMIDHHVQALDIVDIKGYDKYKAVNNDEILKAIDEVMGTTEARKAKDYAALSEAYAKIDGKIKSKIVDNVLTQLEQESHEVIKFLQENEVNMTSDLSQVVSKLDQIGAYAPGSATPTREITYDSKTKRNTFSATGLYPTVHAWVVNNYVNGYFLNDVAAGEMNYFKHALDMGKRMSSVFGSGKKGMIGKNFMRPTARVAIINDPVFSVQNLSAALKDTAIGRTIAEANKGKGIELADGQAYMLPTRRDDLIRGFGEEYGAGDIFKPIYSGTYKREVTLRSGDKATTEVPAIMKDSVIVLTDKLVSKHPLLLELRQQMEKMKVDEAVMASGTKEGAPSKLAEPNNITEASVFEIDNDKYRLQLNPLSKPFKERGTSVPTQILYIINTMNAELGLQKNINATGKIYSALATLYQRGLEKFKSSMLDSKGKVKATALANTMNPASNERLIALLESGADFNLGMLADKVYSQLANSLTKYTTKIKFPGGKLVQQSAFGIQATENQQKLRFIEEGERIYAEVLMPEAYREHTDMGSYLLPDGLSYRIPSTGLNSAVGFKVVGYYPSKGKGDNIIVGPEEIVTQMGSDFDVDSLFVITRAKEKGVPVGYVLQGNKYLFMPTEAELEAPSEKLLINIIVENLLQITSDVVNKDRITDVVSTEEIVTALKELGLHKEVHVNMSRPTSNLEFHQSNFQGLKLTGIFANISKSLAYMVNTGKSAADSVAYPQLRKTVQLGENTYGTFSEKSLAQTSTIWQTLSALVNSAVDNVKEQQLYKMNASNLTGKMYGSALALGMPLKTAMLLMTQPSLRMASATGKLETSKAKLIEVLKKVNPAFVKATNEQIHEFLAPEGAMLTEELLAKNVAKTSYEGMSEEELKFQYAALDQAKTLGEIGDDISTFSSMISIIQGFPSTHEELQRIDNTFNQVLLPEGKGYKTADSFSFDISRLFDAQPNILQAYKNMQELLAITADNIFKHAPMVETFVDDVLKDFPIRLDRLNRSKVKQELMSYLTSGMYAAELDQETPYKYTDHQGNTRFVTGKNAWTQRFIEKYESKFGDRNNHFLEPLAVKSRRGMKLLSFNIDSNINSVEELMLSEGFDRLDGEFQQELIKYAVLHHGMGFGYRNFSAYVAPTSLTKVNDWMKTLDAQVREVATREEIDQETGEVTKITYNPLLERIKEHFGFAMMGVNASSLPGFPKEQKPLPQMENGVAKTVTIVTGAGSTVRNVFSGVDDRGVYYDKEFNNVFEDVVQEIDQDAELPEGTEADSTDEQETKVKKISTFPRFVRERTKTGASIFYLRTTGPQSAIVRYVRLGYQSFGGYEVPSSVLQDGWKESDYFNQPNVLPIKVEDLTTAGPHEVYSPVPLKAGTEVIAFNMNNSGTRDRAVRTVVLQAGDMGNNRYSVTLKDLTPIGAKPKLSKVLDTENRQAADRMVPTIKALVDRFGIPVHVVSPSEMPGGHRDAKGMYVNGMVYLNADLMTSDTAFHEVAHPIISSIREKNPTWYQELEQEMLRSDKGKLTLAQVRLAYPELNRAEQMEEAMVTLIGEMAAGRMDNVSALSKFIKRLMRAIGARVNAVLKEMGLGTLEPQQAANLNLMDLARVLTGEQQALNPELSKLDGDPTKIDLQKSELDEVEQRLFNAGRITISCR